MLHSPKRITCLLSPTISCTQNCYKTFDIILVGSFRTSSIQISISSSSPVDSNYALPVVTNFLCRVTNSAHLVVGPSLSLDQQLGIRCQLTSVIRHVVTSLSDVH